MGFAFDGDADRLIAVDENGNVIDGDMIICGLAKYFKKLGKLKQNTVVGTSHTNMAIEEDLENEGINLIRTDIGDKYVLSKLLEKDLSLGGEQSGHVIIKDYATTGDGILTAIIVANMIINEKLTMSKVLDIKLYPQVNKNVVVEDKFRIMNSEELGREVAKYNAQLKGKGRIMIRASGTEPKIRVMVESKDKILNEKEVRKAIATAIDKDNIVSLVVAGNTIAEKSAHLGDTYVQVAEGMQKVSEGTKACEAQVTAATANLQQLNAVYELQLNTLQAQVDAYKAQNEKIAAATAQVDALTASVQNMNNVAAEALKSQEAYAAGAKQLANQVADLNKVYGNMLNAL
jgi:hypothetical protein